jgi:acetyltransferase-like isoleucine patch superfamily enzyme
MPGPVALAWLRVTWALITVACVEVVVFALSSTLPTLLWVLLWRLPYSNDEIRMLALNLAVLPLYVIFAVALMVSSALSMRVVGWRTPRDVELRIADLDWPLLDWARYMVSGHVVRVLVGLMFRGTPIWSFYVRLNGARLGRRVFINSLAVTDHNLLEFDDDVIIGGGVHLSGHTVEDGFVRTAGVRLGQGTTIGLGSVIGIGVETGSSCRVGALSVVPKFEKLDAGATYVGAPVHKLELPASSKAESRGTATASRTGPHQ